MSGKQMIPILHINGTDVPLEASWEEHLRSEIRKPYFTKLIEKLNIEYKEVCYPSKEFIFNAFNLCPFDKVKVVILGQDPYRGNHAMGLSFSVPDGVKLPPSLRKIYKEIEEDFCKSMPESSGNLTHWAEQGVLLLNTTLTVRAGAANSHKDLGWQEFTDAVIKALSEHHEHIVFMLWGGFARSKKRLIDTNRHCIIESYHPAAMPRYKFTKHQFTCCNAYLKQQGLEEIDWLMRTEKK
ncbi:uracil-DNA glycosylase [Prevotella pallens]|uniref:uracil-DNA glycosylase n=1 Tax=Prevotella pallens TaxID=60133 RepID=UPI001CACCC8C|nr:uracil-DNA glycosylase [Prevotella pallens]MBF1442660.1 uracil-DNA glycosylase [Prevotella pallens]MBF1485061.1 uracil-DNA glycosylase [Prevotella pallens]MBF1494863.1 uracil-DNA glycosylase [Prevotella pallens]MBF1514301.1 uracil-DNA glycosylase [Prevotella pallens]